MDPREDEQERRRGCDTLPPEDAARGIDAVAARRRKDPSMTGSLGLTGSRFRQPD